MGKTYGNRWEILETLDEGGQAHTFIVRDNKGDGERHYVLKRLKNIKKKERFKREIEAIRNSSHKNIIRLIDFDLDNTKPYIVTEYCSGGNLSQAEPFWYNSPVKAMDIFREICEGLNYVHSLKPPIIHRDLKPENIFLRDKNGPAVIGDFGLCYFEEDGTRITHTKEAVGSRFFMAPECENGRTNDISIKTDTYSAGKILYWLLSNGKIFSREIHRERDWDLKGYNTEMPLGWNNIYMEHINCVLDNMIALNPKKRISINAFLKDFKQLLRLIEKEFTPIDKNIKQPCTYCGYGYYESKAINNDEVRNFGFEPVGNPNWRIFTCNMCGHVQSFRIEVAKRSDWWN